ncbi:MAG TPA: hypothetical protein VII73_08735 [Caulobacteraceae bacterium]
MRAGMLLAAVALALAGCTRPAPRPDAAQASMWVADENEKIEALQRRVTQLELRGASQASEIADLEAKARPAPAPSNSATP